MAFKNIADQTNGFYIPLRITLWTRMCQRNWNNGAEPRRKKAMVGPMKGYLNLALQILSQAI